MITEEMRQRQRLYVKRNYYRSLNKMHSLRALVKQLENEYNVLVQSTETTFPNTSNELQIDQLNLMHENEDMPQEKNLRDKYIELSQLKEALLKQNKVYKSRLQEFTKLQNVITRKVVIENDRKMIPYALPQLKLRFSTDDALKFSIQAYQDIMNFRNSNIVLTTGAKVLGWTDRRKLEEDKYSFSIKKVFRGYTPEDLAFGGWSTKSAATFDMRSFDPSMDVRTFLIQVINEDSVLLYRLIFTPDKTVVFKDLFVASRYQIENGYQLVFRSIDPYKHLDLSLSEKAEEDANIHAIWHPHFAWFLFENVPGTDRDSLVELGGILPKSYEESTRGSETWMISFLFMALRVESMIAAPVYICNT